MSLARALLDLLAPALCPLCRRSLPMDALDPTAPLCRACARGLPWWRVCDGCPHCGHWMPLGPTDETDVFEAGATGCPGCLAHGSPLHGCHALLRYTGVLRHWIPAFKGSGSAFGPPVEATAIVGWLASRLGDRLRVLAGEPPDWIVPLPLHAARRRRRGFNQSEWIAARVAHRLERPCRPRALVRLRATGPQAGLAAPARRANVRNAFALRPGMATSVAGRRIWIVDDVLTTGHTLEAAAEPLLAAGAWEVRGVTLAATLPARRRVRGDGGAAHGTDLGDTPRADRSPTDPPGVFMEPARSETSSLRIPARFNGPPGSGNGGWVGGALARELPGPAIRVRLQRPPPLETELQIAPDDDGGVALLDGGTPVARAWPTTLDLAAPPPVAFDDAVEAARGFRGFTEHAFPGCFVCGTERREGDGLRLFPGPVPGRPEPGLVAAPWIPAESLVETARAGDEPSGAAIDPVFVWAALDCPGCFSFPQPEGAFLLLGELTVRIDRPIAPGDRCVVVGWLLGQEGRKHTTGTAVYDGAGRCCGVARAIWIEVARD